MNEKLKPVISERKPEKLNYIQKLILAGESEVIDFKKEISSKFKIAVSIVAFANHKGGTLLIGVNDNKTIHGVSPEEERFMIKEAAEFFCKPPLELTVNERSLQGKVILEVIIPQGDVKPYYAKSEEGKWWVYIRSKDQCILASKVVVDVLKKKQKQVTTLIQYGTKEQALFEYLKNYEKITLKEFCKLLGISRQKATKILVNLISVGVIQVHGTEKEEFYTLN